MKKSVFILALASLMWPSCSKYPEGPGISFKSKTDRLTQKWRFESVKEDGAYITAQYDGVTFEFKSDGSMSTFANWSGTQVEFPGTWEWTADKTGIIIEQEDTSYANSFSSNWKIIRLSQEQLKAEEDYLGTLYEYDMRPI
ncbi:MAG: hypothetical protein ACE5DN_06540 [Flavobacteriales bacterium]